MSEVSMTTQQAMSLMHMALENILREHPNHIMVLAEPRDFRDSEDETIIKLDTLRDAVRRFSHDRGVRFDISELFEMTPEQVEAEIGMASMESYQRGYDDGHADMMDISTDQLDVINSLTSGVTELQERVWALQDELEEVREDYRTLQIDQQDREVNAYRKGRYEMRARIRHLLDTES